MAHIANGMITAEQKAFWDAYGFLIVRSALNMAECAEIDGLVSAEWDAKEGNDHVIDISTGPSAHQWFRLDQAPPNARNEVYKLNNLFARRSRIRDLALKPILKHTIAGLLEGEPIICNSLNFERGSQQPYHLDTWYMPPPLEDRMVAINIALEEVDVENGPLTFFPGSHQIPYFEFSNGGTSFVPAEVGACTEYLDAQVRQRQLEPEVFTCKAGDVFIWHARLYHGGTPISDLGRTRRSMVVHYWRSGDLPKEAVRVDNAGTYLGRTLRGELQF